MSKKKNNLVLEFIQESEFACLSIFIRFDV